VGMGWLIRRSCGEAMYSAQPDELDALAVKARCPPAEDEGQTGQEDCRRRTASCNAHLRAMLDIPVRTWREM